MYLSQEFLMLGDLSDMETVKSSGCCFFNLPVFVVLDIIILEVINCCCNFLCLLMYYYHGL